MGPSWVRRLVVAACAVLAVPTLMSATAGATTATSNAVELPEAAAGTEFVSADAGSCPSRSWCAAVGQAEQGDGVAGGTRGVRSAPTGWIGSGGSWTAQSLPLPPNQATVPNANMASLSCPSPGHCIAIGTYSLRRTVNNLGVVVETLTRGRWQATYQALASGSAPSGDFSYMAGISCSSIRSCVAVGSALNFRTEANDDPVVFRLRDGRWSKQLLALPAGSVGADLSSVSCSSSRCVAAGRVESAAGSTHGLIMQSTSFGPWREVAALGPAGTTLTGVDCVRRSCAAVGGAQQPDHPTTAVVVDTSGTTWRMADRRHLGAVGKLRGVSCASEGHCTAVGALHAGGSALVLGKGQEWRRESSRAAGSLVGISCPTGTDCIVVGHNGRAARVAQLRRGQLTASRLSTLRPPGVAALSAVVCQQQQCLAVGGYEFRGHIFDLAGTLSPQHVWQPYRTAIRSTAGGLEAVSCPPGDFPRGCVAVGGDSIVTFGRTRITSSTLPHAAGLSSVNLAGLSCPTTRRCVAVGTGSSDSKLVPVVAVGYARHWKMRALTGDAGRYGASLASVSCWSASGCIAVGSVAYTPLGAGNTHGLAVRLDRGRWHATVVDSSATNVGMQAVTCTAPRRCVSVGTANFGGAIFRRTHSWKVATLSANGVTSLGSLWCNRRSHCVALASDPSRPDRATRVAISPHSAQTTGDISGPPRAVSNLAAISCTNLDHCTVVGGDLGRRGAFAIAGNVASSR